MISLLIFPQQAARGINLTKSGWSRKEGEERRGQERGIGGGQGGEARQGEELLLTITTASAKIKTIIM